MKIKLVFYIIFILIWGCQIPTKQSTIKYEKPKPSLDAFFEDIAEPEKDEIKLQSKKSINIAVLLPVTGVYERIGSEGLDSIILAQKYLGERVNIKVFDTGGQKANISKIHDKILEENFDVIIGPLFNFETKEIAQFETRLPIISLSNDSSIKQNNILIFGLNSEEGIKEPLSFFSEFEKRNLMAMFPNSSAGAKNYKTFKNYSQHIGQNIMRVEFYDETGISDISKYTAKITGGVIQKTYTSKLDGKIIPERTVKENEKADPNFIASNIYNVKEEMVDVIFISGSKERQAEIVNIFNRPYNREKLKDVSLVMLDFDFQNANINLYNNTFFYANSYAKFKRFSSEIKETSGYLPSKLSGVIFDAIFYAVYVNNKSMGGINAKKIHTEYEGFNGVMGSFVVRNNYVKRSGNMMFIQNGKVKELVGFDFYNSKNILDKNIETNINYLQEDFD